MITYQERARRAARRIVESNGMEPTANGFASVRIVNSCGKYLAFAVVGRRGEIVHSEHQPGPRSAWRRLVERLEEQASSCR